MGIKQVMDDRWAHRWDAEPPKTDKRQARKVVLGFFGVVAWLGLTGWTFGNFNSSYGEDATPWGFSFLFLLFLPLIIGAIWLLVLLVRVVRENKRRYIEAGVDPEDVERRRRNWQRGEQAALGAAALGMWAWNIHDAHREAKRHPHADALSRDWWNEPGNDSFSQPVDLSGYDRPFGGGTLPGGISAHYTTGNPSDGMQEQFPFLGTQRQGRW